MNKEDADAFPNAEILHPAWILFIARATSLGFLLQKDLSAKGNTGSVHPICEVRSNNQWCKIFPQVGLQSLL
jgi:hypothetical protein